jgi:hypothetical protein
MICSFPSLPWSNPGSFIDNLAESYAAQAQWIRRLVEKYGLRGRHFRFERDNPLTNSTLVVASSFLNEDNSGGCFVDLGWITE